MNEDYIPIPAYICISILSMVFAYSSLNESSTPLQVEEPASFTSSLPPIADTFSKIGSVLPSVNTINPFAKTGDPAVSNQPAPAVDESVSNQPATSASTEPSALVPPPAAAPQENIPVAIPVRGGKRRQTKTNKQTGRRKQRRGSIRKSQPKCK